MVETPTLPDPTLRNQGPRIQTVTQEDTLSALRTTMMLEITALRQEVQNLRTQMQTIPADPKGKAVEAQGQENHDQQPNVAGTEGVVLTNQTPEPVAMATQFPGGQSANNQFYNPYQGYQSGYHGWAPQYGYYGYIPYPPPQAGGPGIAEPAQGTTSGQYNPLQPNALPGAQPTGPVTPTLPQAEGIFAPHVQAAQLDTHYKIPVKLTPYTGEKDPEDHMRSFQIAMQISNMGDPQRCKLFPATLEGPALDWFSRLPYGSIHCFRDLEKLFMKRFASSKVYKQPQAVLADVHQSKGETLRDYLARFNKTCLGIKDIDERVAVHAFLAGIRPGFAQKELAYRNPSSLGDLLTQVEEFITKEDLDRTQRNRFARMDPDDKLETIERLYPTPGT